MFTFVEILIKIWFEKTVLVVLLYFVNFNFGNFEHVVMMPMKNNLRSFKFIFLDVRLCLLILDNWTLRWLL